MVEAMTFLLRGMLSTAMLQLLSCDVSSKAQKDLAFTTTLNFYSTVDVSAKGPQEVQGHLREGPPEALSSTLESGIS